MKRWLPGLALGLVVGAAAHGEPQSADRLKDVPVTTSNNAAFKLPSDYGRLVSVAVRAEVHHLYFEGEDGTVRIVLIGPRGAIQRARNELQLLTPEVYVIKRGREGDSS